MTEDQAKAQQTRIRGDDGAPAAYANVCNITAGPEELWLHFGQATADNPAEAAHLFKVCMSLPHAKRMALALMNTIGAYEGMFGEVTANALERLAPEARQRLGLDSGEEGEDAS